MEYEIPQFCAHNIIREIRVDDFQQHKRRTASDLIIHYINLRGISKYSGQWIGKLKIPDHNKIIGLTHIKGYSVGRYRQISPSEFLKCVIESNLDWEHSTFKLIRQIILQFDMCIQIAHLMFQWSKSKHNKHIFFMIVKCRLEFARAFSHTCNFTTSEIDTILSHHKNRRNILIKMKLIDAPMYCPKQIAQAQKMEDNLNYIKRYFAGNSQTQHSQTQHSQTQHSQTQHRHAN